MSKNTNNNHITKNKEEIVVKTPFDFQLGKSDSTHQQTQPVNNEFNIHHETDKHYEYVSRCCV